MIRTRRTTELKAKFIGINEIDERVYGAYSIAGESRKGGNSEKEERAWWSMVFPEETEEGEPQGDNATLSVASGSEEEGCREVEGDDKDSSVKNNPPNGD